MGISILSIVCIVLIGLSLLSGRFFPGTYIENVDVSLLKREEAQELFSKKRQDAYHLAIIDKNGNQEDLYGKDIQLRYDSDFSHIPKPDSFYLLFSLGKKKNYDLEGSLHYDEAALDAFITKYLEKYDSDEEARAAFLTAYIPGKGYTVGDEQWSGKIDRDKFRNMLIQAISEGTSRIDLREGDFYQKPEAKTEELKPVAEEKNKSLQALLRYNFSGEAVELTPDRYHQW
ncbi:MAG: peptidoglycan binding domain-containing protein, partial [Oribacterium sinus]|nr:peptidoglycan binding domain-containing protein [Oribacterium sinus]